MTTFGWKRKSTLSSSAAAVFTDESKIGYDPETNEVEEGVDWLSAAKRRRLILLEDSIAKSKRLREEGALLAENERYWEAIKYWDEAIQLTPDSAVLHEMKSQMSDLLWCYLCFQLYFSLNWALLELGEIFPAVEVAEKAVQLDPTWAIARQTLGRAQLGLGEVEMALKSFEKAVHLDPSNQEIRDEDLKWAQELVKKKEAMKSKLEEAKEKTREDILEKLRGNQVNHCEDIPNEM